jgi:hypothetical protein
MQRKRLKPSSEKYIWIDFEAYATEANEKCHPSGLTTSCPCGKDCLPGTQHMNLVVMIDFNNNIKIFNNEDELCKELFTHKYQDYTVLAHNAKGYDSQPIARWLISRNITPKVVY